MGIACLILLAQPLRALQVKTMPSAPRLGDTISVVFQVEDPTITKPTVTLGKKTYPAFPMGANRFRSLLPTTPLDQAGALNLQVITGAETQKLTVNLKNRSFPTQRIWLPPGKDKLGTDYEFDRVAAFKALVTPEKYWTGPFKRPNQGEITAVYGIRRYYNGVFAKDYFHRGVDYAGGTGSPIVAPASGRVALIGRESQGFEIHGNTIGIDHGQGVVSIFLHLSQINVKEGDFVQAGQRIGAVGATGAVTGPHLHWGLYVNGLCVDPVPWREKGFE
ncbi:peptidase [Leptolyngbya sp. 'hensonii']|nr:peptidase [Leptolyngbya sp. 'hensonii']